MFGHKLIKTEAAWELEKQYSEAHCLDHLSNPVMKIKKANAGALTNFEVLDFLRSRGAAKDPTRVIAPIAASEFKVYDYLVESAACNQTRESVHDFLEKSQKYGLAKAEILNIINIRPASQVEIDPIIEECEKRMGEGIEELIEMVMTVLPPPPAQMNTEEEVVADDDGDEEMPPTSTLVNAQEDAIAEDDRQMPA